MLHQSLEKLPETFGQGHPLLTHNRGLQPSLLFPEMGQRESEQFSNVSSLADLGEVTGKMRFHWGFLFWLGVLFCLQTCLLSISSMVKFSLFTQERTFEAKKLFFKEKNLKQHLKLMKC